MDAKLNFGLCKSSKNKYVFFCIKNMFTKNKELGGYWDKQRLKYSKFAASARIVKCTAAVALKMCS